MTFILFFVSLFHCYSRAMNIHVHYACVHPRAYHSSLRIVRREWCALKVSLLSVWLDFEIIDVNRKRSALRHRCYGKSCYLETKRNIHFDHRFKRWCSMMEIEASLPCEIFISNDPPQCQITVVSLLKRKDILTTEQPLNTPYSKMATILVFFCSYSN